MRKFTIPAVLLLIVGSFIAWRALRPALSDEAQIAVNLDALCAAASARSPRGVANYLAKDFKIGGLDKKEFQNSLAGGILQYRVVDLKVSSVKSAVKGETATSAGRFTLSLKSEYKSPPDVKNGDFRLQWRKIDGEWKISGADVPDLGSFGN